MHDRKAPRLDGLPPGSEKGEYRPQIVADGVRVDAITYYSTNPPRRPANANPPHDLFDGPLPGQTFEAWREQLQGEYYKPPAA